MTFNEIILCLDWASAGLCACAVMAAIRDNKVGPAVLFAIIAALNVALGVGEAVRIIQVSP